jgi:hypothetical protein
MNHELLDSIHDVREITETIMKAGIVVKSSNSPGCYGEQLDTYTDDGIVLLAGRLLNLLDVRVRCMMEDLEIGIGTGTTEECS